MDTILNKLLSSLFPVLRILTWMVASVGMGSLVYGQPGKDEVLTIKHTADFALTGDGTAPAWNTTEWISLTKYKGLATYTTRAKLLYSDTGIYGMFSCSDEKITATLTEDFADLYKEDVVESPLNHELAILVPNFGGDFFGWKPWHYEGVRKTKHSTAIKKNERGNATSWTAEFFIPYALLKPLENVPPKSGTQWKMNMYRIDYDQGYSSWLWKPVESNFHDFKRFGTIRFE